MTLLSMLDTLKPRLVLRMPRLLCRLAAMLLLAAALPAQSATIARADGTGGYELWSALPGGPAQLLGGSVHFLPLDLAGDTFRDHLRLDLPVVAGADSPAPHIRLPGGGSLFLIDASGATALLRIAADGSLSVPFAVAAGDLQLSLAVASDGSRALLATTQAAGGDVVLVDLEPNASAPPLVLTAAQAPLAIDASSLRTSAERSFFVAGNGLWRADLTAVGPASQALPVALPVGPGDTLLPETVLSADGRSLALLSRDPSTQSQLHVVTPFGVPVLLNAVPAAIDAPALQSPIGPLLALSPDGTLAAWRQTIGPSKEVFLQAVPQPGPPPPAATQLTADTYFIDTLDSAGILGFVNNVVLSFVAGEAGGQAVGAADLFVAQLGVGGGGPALQNATLTSGVSLPPFLVPGDLEISAAMLDATSTRMLFIVDPHGGDAALFSTAADGSGTPAMLLPTLQQDPVLVRAGQSVLVQSVPEGPGVPKTQLHLLRPAGVAPLLLGTLPAGTLLDRFTDSADGTSAAFVAHAGPLAPMLQLPVRLDTSTGALLPAWSQLLQVSPLMALPPSGALIAGVGAAGGPYLSVAFTGFEQGSLLKVPMGFTFPLPY